MIEPKAFWRERDSALRMAIASGASASEAAAALGVTKNMAIGRARRAELVWARSTGPMDAPPKTPRPQHEWPAPGHCVWPKGNPRRTRGRGKLTFCGCPVEPSRPYCATHMLVAYLPKRPRKPRA